MELPRTLLAGDGAPGPAPEAPGAGVDVGAVLVAILDSSLRQEQEQRAQTALLHRILLGDLDVLTADDVKRALGCGDRKLDELVEAGDLPMFQMKARGPRRILRETFRAVLRTWAG